MDRRAEPDKSRVMDSSVYKWKNKKKKSNQGNDFY